VVPAFSDENPKVGVHNNTSKVNNSIFCKELLTSSSHLLLLEEACFLYLYV
jgi:hypothetical protein